MGKIENRYARALLDLTEESENLEEDLAQAALVRDALDDQDIGAFLTHPHIPRGEKSDLLRRVFSGKISEYLMGLLQLMVRKNRSDFIISTLTEYIAHAERRLGKTEAIIVSATPLSRQQIESVRNVITEHVNMRIRMKTVVDPNVIGGFRVVVDGRVFDATVRFKINRLKEYLKRGGSYANQAR